MEDYLNEFKKQCKKISNKFNVNNDISSCFVCNFGEDSDICRECSRKTSCSKIAEQLNVETQP